MIFINENNTFIRFAQSIKLFILLYIFLLRCICVRFISVKSFRFTADKFPHRYHVIYFIARNLIARFSLWEQFCEKLLIESYGIFYGSIFRDVCLFPFLLFFDLRSPAPWGDFVKCVPRIKPDFLFLCFGIVGRKFEKVNSFIFKKYII